MARNTVQENNKLQQEDRAFHDWYRFVLSFPPHLVRDYLRRFGADSTTIVLDPFCGTGTTLVECKKLGIPSVGVEASPVAEFASRVKADWSVRPGELLSHSQNIAEIATQKLAADGMNDSGALPLITNNARPLTELRTLAAETSKLLLKDSISPLPLHKLLVLLETIDENKITELYDCERLALAKALVSGVSNLHFGPEVGVGRPREDAPVISTWLNNVRVMANDLLNLGKNVECLTTVHHGDARYLTKILEPDSIDIVITSPPYPNEKDYTRTTRLEAVLLGFVKNKAELRALKNDLVRSNTRNVFKGDSDDALVSNNSIIQAIAVEIENRRIQLRKTSGFERLYARVTKLYFGGMTRHLQELRTVLRPGARLAYVVGDQSSYLRVKIRTGQILADIAQSIGYKLVSIDLFRTRMATATKEQLREEVVVLRWPT